MPVQNSNISMNNINQADSYYSDSLISEPKLYATDLQFSITDKELADQFVDVPPIKFVSLSLIHYFTFLFFKKKNQFN